MRLSIRQVFVLFLFIALFVVGLRPIADPDFWWHLRTGQFIVESLTVPQNDIFSYTNYGKFWIAHEWLSEVFIYCIFKVGGIALLILVFSAIITGSFLLIYRISPGHPYIAGFILLLGALATAPTWGVRPQMISLFFFSAFLYLLERYYKNLKKRYIILLPLLIMLWVNLHGSYPLGLLLIIIYISGDLFLFLKLKKQIDIQEKKAIKQRIQGLALILLSCILAVMINPNGLSMYVYPFETLTSPTMQKYIQEWFSPDFHQLEWQPLEWLILAVVLFSMLSRHPISATKMLLIMIFGYAALRSMRHVPMFALIAIPILAEQVNSLIPIKPKYSSEHLEHIPNRTIWVNLLLLISSLLLIRLRFLSTLQAQSFSESVKFPTVAVDWITQNQPTGNIFNSYSWGGYLIWRLYPEYQVFIDGRADLYGDEFIEYYLNIYRSAPGWEEELLKNNIKLVLVEPDSQLALSLVQSTSWFPIVTNSQSILFQKR